MHIPTIMPWFANFQNNKVGFFGPTFALVVAGLIGVKVIKFTSWGSGGNVYKLTLDYTDITKITIAAAFLTGDRTGSIVDIVLSRGQYGLKAGLSNSVDGSNNHIRVLSHEYALYIKAEDYVYGCISMDCVVNCEKVTVSDIPNDALVLL